MSKAVLAACVLLAATSGPLLARTSHHSSFGGNHHSSSSIGYHYTRSYTTRRGAFVEGHNDTNPDKHFGNNWSTKGNTDPFSGKEGTKVTAPNGEPN